MNILFAASELAPYAHTGELGDAISSLSAAVARRKHTVSIVVPLHRGIREKLRGIRKTDLSLPVSLSGSTVYAPVWEGKTSDGIAVFAIQRDEFFDRSFLYGNEDGDYADNASRFAFFNRVVVELAKHIEPMVDVIHLHDWHVGLIPSYVRAWDLPFKTVFTIHNLAYQGSFSDSVFGETGLPHEYFSPMGAEFFGKLNFLKAGIMLAHTVTTVGPSYAAGIQTEQYSYGMHDVLKSIHYKFSGICNGSRIDGPSDDDVLASFYSAKQLEGRLLCKKDLLKTFKWKDEVPVFGIVSPLTAFCGMDIVMGVLNRFLERDAKLIILGEGEKKYEDELSKLAKKHSQKLRIKISSDSELCRNFFSGCDFLIYPAEFESWNNSLLQGLKYGGIPIVHASGFANDVVQECLGSSGNGLKFCPYTSDALLTKIDMAMQLFRDQKNFTHLRKNAMCVDFSWDACAEAYEKIYDEF